MAYPDLIDPTERQIIDVIIKKALALGSMINVYGDGELDLKWSNDYDEITSQIAACDTTAILIDDCFWLLFVHGNGADVLSDHSAGDIYDEFLKEANDLAESLQ